MVLPLAFLLPETHGPTILSRRAKRLRLAGKTNAYAAHERQRVSTKEFVQKNISRPIGEDHFRTKCEAELSVAHENAYSDAVHGTYRHRFNDHRHTCL